MYPGTEYNKKKFPPCCWGIPVSLQNTNKKDQLLAQADVAAPYFQHTLNKIHNPMS